MKKRSTVGLKLLMSTPFHCIKKEFLTHMKFKKIEKDIGLNLWE